MPDLINIPLGLPSTHPIPDKNRPWVVVERRIYGRTRFERAVSSHSDYAASEKAVKFFYSAAQTVCSSLGAKEIFAKEAEDTHFYKFFSFPDAEYLLGISYMMESI